MRRDPFDTSARVCATACTQAVPSGDRVRAAALPTESDPTTAGNDGQAAPSGDRVRRAHLDSACAAACKEAAMALRACAEKQDQASCRDAMAAARFAADLCYQCGLPCCYDCAESCWSAAYACRSGPSEDCKAMCEKAAEACEMCGKECDAAASAPSRSSGDDGSIREIALVPDSWDEKLGRCRAVLVTDTPAYSLDVRTRQKVLEVWRPDGLEYEESIPLLDNHNTASVRNVLGSIRESTRAAHDIGGWLYVSESEPDIRTKIREGHIRCVSGRVIPKQAAVIPPGRSATIRGEVYTAPANESLIVHTQGTLAEVSLTWRGGDPGAKIRSHSLPQPEVQTIMLPAKTRKFLESIGLASTAADADAQAFYTALPASTRALADAKANEPDPQPGTVRTVAEPPPAVDMDDLRKQARAAEKVRTDKIRELAKGNDELIRTAIDEDWTVEATQQNVALLTKFGKMGDESQRQLQEHRTRTDPVGAGFAIHSTGPLNGVTGEILGMAASLRSLQSLSATQAGYTMASNPVALFGGYRPTDADGVIRSSNDWTFYDPPHAQATRKANVERMLEQADRFRSCSLIDLCRIACQLEGKALSTWSPAEVVRTATSTGAFAAIFTTNFNALFLAGYLEASDTTVGWCSESDAPNFLTGELAAMGKFGNLTLDGGASKPAEHMTAGDWNETVKVHRYTGQFVLDEKDIINDRFGALQSISPQEMGLAARRLRPDLVYSTIMSNPTLNQDAKAVFHADHSNYATAASAIYTVATGAVNVGPIQTAISAMNSQRLNNIPLNLQPRFMLIPPVLRWGAAVLFQSAERVIASGSGGTYNPLRDLGIEPRMDSRLGAGGCYNPLTKATVAGSDAHWFLLCRPGEEGAKTMEVRYLQGTGRSPQIRSFVLDRGQWGIGWDVKHDLGVVPLDFRGMYYGTGSA